MGVYVAFAACIQVNIESLNAVESIGNIIRHRKAQLVIYDSKAGGYRIVTVPVISGEALRHGYQAMLADLAVEKGLPVCSWCKAHEFVKHGVRALYTSSERSVLEDRSKSLAEKEEFVIKSCVVEDVGGFLAPLEPPLKRTSRLQISYMVPALDTLETRDAQAGGATATSIQFGVRHAPQAQQELERRERREERREEAQTIYHREVGSSVYTFSGLLDVSGIGVTSNCVEVESSGAVKIECRKISLDERVERAKLAIMALRSLFEGRFGGARSSVLPHWRLLSAVLIVTKPLPPPVPYGHYQNYIENTRRSLEKLKHLHSDVNFEYEVYDVANGSLERLYEALQSAAERATEWMKQSEK